MNELISVTNETQAGIEESAQSIEVQRKYKIFTIYKSYK